LSPTILALFGFGMVIAFMVLIMTKRMSALASLIVIPIVVAAIAGFGPEIGAMGIFSGNRLTRNPRNKWTISPAYERRLGSGAVVAGAVDVQYESFIFDDIDNNALNVRPAKTLVDARLVFTSPDGHWEASVWGKNLGDEVYITHQYILTGGQFAFYGEPRTFGATVRWRY